MKQIFCDRITAKHFQANELKSFDIGVERKKIDYIISWNLHEITSFLMIPTFSSFVKFNSL